MRDRAAKGLQEYGSAHAAHVAHSVSKIRAYAQQGREQEERRRREETVAGSPRVAPGTTREREQEEKFRELEAAAP
jgi:hypothetical protein